MPLEQGVICMAVYRPDPTLVRRQIDSLRNQTLTDWRCFVGVDGADTDTTDLLSTLVGQDQRFTIFAFEERLGFYRNFERLLGLVPRNSAWIALADQDDRWYPEKLETLVAWLSEFSLVSGQARLIRIGENHEDEVDLGVTSRNASNLGEMLFDNAVSGALAVFRGDVLRIALPFPKQTDVSYHDHWLGVCAFVLDGVKFLPTPVQDYIQHGSNVIGEEYSSISQRFRSLAMKASGVRGFSYVVSHRWKWRVYMTRALLVQTANLRAKDRKVLFAFARNAFSINLLKIGIVALKSGRASRLRVAGLLCASIFAPLIERSPNERQERY